MKTITHLTLVAAALTCITLSSCVTKGKYGISESRGNRLQRDSTQTHNLLDACNLQVRNLGNDKDHLLLLNEATQQDLKNLASKSKMTIAEQAKRLADLQNLIQAQRDAMNRLKKTISDALINFKADELYVYEQDGKVYVSLQEKLLFKSGSAVVDPKGKEALGSLAKVLNTTGDISVMIEGHTDTIPMKRPEFADNWALSTGRATSIVRILTKDYGVDPHTITSAGRGEFHPVKTNATPEGKAGNRRTEIIISPNLN
ncbi:MAG: OmpA family protein, partial [Bacteroidota bacterium]